MVGVVGAEQLPGELVHVGHLSVTQTDVENAVADALEDLGALCSEHPLGTEVLQDLDDLLDFDLALYEVDGPLTQAVEDSVTDGECAEQRDPIERQ